jgi:hypothetical protein
MSDKRPVSMSFLRNLFTGAIRVVRPNPLALFAGGMALALALLAVGTAHAQGGPPVIHPPLAQPVNPNASGLDDRSEPDPADAARRIRALNNMRQKALVSDTNKLLKLASEFEAEIHIANSDSLTQEQLHKLATIEKLARSIKEKMSIPVAELPSYQPGTPPPMH